MPRSKISYEEGDVVYYTFSDEDDERTVIVHNNMDESLLGLEQQGKTEIHINTAQETLDSVRQRFGDKVATRIRGEFE